MKTQEPEMELLAVFGLSTLRKGNVKGHRRKLKSGKVINVRGHQRHDKPRVETQVLQKLRTDGWTIETDPEVLYWHDSYNRSIAARNRIDIRTKGKRKPILLSHDNIEVLIEWDYGREDGAGWIAWELNSGNIICAGVKRFDALLNIAYTHAAWLQPKEQ
jgi:hypothetical protein